jgi:alpha-L-arabinofuranosidase
VSGRSNPPAVGRAIVLTGPGLGAGNSFENPTNVAPVERKLERVGNSFDYVLPACSFTVLRLR